MPGLTPTEPLPSCLTLICPVSPDRYLFPLPSENSSEYDPFPRMTRSPALCRAEYIVRNMHVIWVPSPQLKCALQALSMHHAHRSTA